MLVGSLVAAVLSPNAQATSVQRFAVRQATQLNVGTPSVRAFLDVEDVDGNPVQDLPVSSLTATLGQWPAELTELETFDSSQQGVAYVFLVDISKSLNQDLFGRMIAGLETWVDNLGPLDRAALIAFGEASSLSIDFTDDKHGLRTALRSLGPTDSETVLHQALIDALELSRRLDPDLPGRRAIVVFGDGKDEGSGLGAEDVLARFRDGPTPIYALGYSRLRDPAERESYLQLLHRFATNSGGESFEAQESQFAEAYEAIRHSIAGVWVADFACQDCRPDSTVHRLQVQLNLEGKVLSDGRPVRLLALAGVPATASEVEGSEPLSADLSADDKESEDSSGDAEETRSGATDSKIGFWILLALVVTTIALVVRRKTLATNRRRAAAERLLEDHSLHRVAPLDPEIRPGGPVSATADRRKRPKSSQTDSEKSVDRGRPLMTTKAVRLVVIRGSRQGRQYPFILKETGVIGSRSDCDCMLADEPGIDAAQFELYFDGSKMFIRNLSEKFPTLLNGQVIAGRAEMLSNTLVGTERTIVRVVFE